MKKIISYDNLAVGTEYLLVQPKEGISVNVFYIGCAVGQYKLESVGRFGNNYQLILPEDSIQSAYTHTLENPCNTQNTEKIHIYFFRSKEDNINKQSKWSFDIVNSVDDNIPSTTHNYKLYKYSGTITQIDDNSIKCDWEHEDVEMIKHIFDVLVMSADEAEYYSTKTLYGNKSITDAIKSGIFTSKIVNVVDNNPIVQIDQINLQAIEGWYELASKLSGILYIEGQQYWCVYRVVKDVDIILNGKIIQPLPFSSTYNLEWVKREWSGENLCCLLKILIPFNAPMVVIEPPNEPMYMDKNSQYEIVLPAGILHKQRIDKDTNGLLVGSYILEPWSLEYCKYYISVYNTTNFPNTTN